MGAVLALLVVVVAAWAIIVVGATAYELTGLDRETARFQALSAFTGAGFTTRVSELVVRHPVRRRITGTLIILGYGGTATVVGSVIASFQTSLIQGLERIATAGLLLFFAFLLARRFGLEFTDRVRRLLTSRFTVDRVPHEELMLYARGFGITRIEIPPDSRVLGASLRELDLRAWHVQVLAVEEDRDVYPIPSPDWRFEAGQHLIVYGDLRRVQEAFGPADPVPLEPERETREN